MPLITQAEHFGIWVCKINWLCVATTPSTRYSFLLVTVPCRKHTHTVPKYPDLIIHCIALRYDCFRERIPSYNAWLLVEQACWGIRDLIIGWDAAAVSSYFHWVSWMSSELHNAYYSNFWTGITLQFGTSFTQTDPQLRICPIVHISCWVVVNREEGGQDRDMLTLGLGADLFALLCSWEKSSSSGDAEVSASLRGVQHAYCKTPCCKTCP